jgi:hypothetical protein
MIISDLNLLETVEAADIVGGTSSKNVNLQSSVKQNFDVDIKIDAKKNIKSLIEAKSDVKGNSAITVFDNTALGPQSYVETNVSNFTAAGYGSESSGSLFAAANK